MPRQVIQIDEEKCNGCGLCVNACHEGALGLVGGKAKLLRDDFCDGMGDCLPSCPQDAISFVEREALTYDEAAVIAAQMARAKLEAHAQMPASGCPGSQSKTIAPAMGVGEGPERAMSELRQWPVQIKLAPVNASWLAGADVLVAADCCAYAYARFHADFIKGRVCLVGCPKLDGVNYTEKLTAMFAANDVRSVLVARMEVPCCGGIEAAVRNAVIAAGKQIPVEVRTIGTDGTIR